MTDRRRNFTVDAICPERCSTLRYYPDTQEVSNRREPAHGSTERRFPSLKTMIDSYHLPYAQRTPIFVPSTSISPLCLWTPTNTHIYISTMHLFLSQLSVADFFLSSLLVLSLLDADVNVAVIIAVCVFTPSNITHLVSPLI